MSAPRCNGCPHAAELRSRGEWFGGACTAVAPSRRIDLEDDEAPEWCPLQELTLHQLAAMHRADLKVRCDEYTRVRPDGSNAYKPDEVKRWALEAIEVARAQADERGPEARASVEENLTPYLDVVRWADARLAKEPRQ